MSGAGKPSHTGNVHYLNPFIDNPPSGEFFKIKVPDREQTRARVRGWEQDDQTQKTTLYCFIEQLVPNICKHEINLLMGTNCLFFGLLFWLDHIKYKIATK